MSNPTYPSAAYEWHPIRGGEPSQGEAEMKSSKRQALIKAGFRVGDAEDFLELSEEERRLVDLRLSVSRAVRRLRQKRRLTQQALAQKLGSSQSRIAKLEAGQIDVSLDLLFRGLFAVGGKLSDVKASGA